jgi:hypothetical protein
LYLTRSLYRVVEEKKVGVEGFMGSEKQYDLNKNEVKNVPEKNPPTSTKTQDKKYKEFKF